tara:strand:- start:135 stop:617 length:483 start_codon:yes stop_codon:yes gene_type:complete
MFNIFKKIFLILLSLTLMLPQQKEFPYKANYESGLYLDGKKYITGDDGVVRMNINIWGHVKYPGIYLMYENIDIYTALSLAGGPLKGAKVSKISIISDDGSSRIINLDKFSSDFKGDKFKLKPHDTIHVDEKTTHLLLSKSAIISVLLQLTNLILINNND